MKLDCPKCNQPIPASDIALDKGWAKCVRCDEVFPLAGILPGFDAGETASPQLPERPFDAWSTLQRQDKSLVILIPAYGMRAAVWGILGFATFWLAFIAFWTAGALGVFFNGGPFKWENVLFAAFSTPFWLVGIGMLAVVLWLSRGTRSLYIDPAQMVTELRCLAWHRIRSRQRDEVQCARAGTPVATNSNTQSGPGYSPHWVEVIFTKGSFKLPCDNESEKLWLIAQINDFLQAVPYDPAYRT